MADNSRLELLKLHRTGQEKHVYFLLTAAAAAIAFAITQTQTATLSASKIPLGFAVLCWALSFLNGCNHLWEVTNLTQQNYQILRTRAGLHPKFPADPNFVAAIEQSIEEQAEQSGRFSARQFKFLIAGAVFYIAWHILEMYLRTGVLNLMPK
jgi:hypothetical protein